jgi:hypothetical protein
MVKRIVDESQYFFVSDGSVIKNRLEMKQFFMNADDSVLGHHVNGERNDFVGWVREVLGDKALAIRLESALNREELVNACKNSRKSRKIVDDKQSIISKLVHSIKNS